MNESGGETVTQLRPQPWYLLVTAISGFTGGGLYAIVFAGSWSAAVVGLVVIPIVVAVIVKLELTPTGVSLQGVSATWDQFVLSRGPFGHRLRVPKEIASQQRKRLRVYLPMWESNWREGAIGDHLRRYAPDLLDEA